MRIDRFRRTSEHRHGGGRIIRGLSGALAAVLFGSVLASSGTALPANAAEDAAILISKTVNEKKEVRDLRPGDSVTYTVEFISNDEDADGPAIVVDKLPAAFAGWQITDLVATFDGQRNGVSLDLPGITRGESPLLPVSGKLSSDPAELEITVEVALPVQPGPGNSNGKGMPTGAQGEIQYTLTVPSDLDPNSSILRTDLVNTATFTAFAGLRPLSVSSSATIEVDNPVKIDVTPTKSWTPSGQNFEPGALSEIVIGATQASNVPVSALRLQDPSDPALSPDGATTLPAGNPFNFVDFAGFSAPSDPLNNLPSGADSASAEVYLFNGSVWNWVQWTSSIRNDQVAGVRTSYESSTHAIAPGATMSQGFSVVQREVNRASGKSISEGWNTKNEVLATVEAPGLPSVSQRASADFVVAAERVDVGAQKAFYTLTDRDEVANLTGVTAGDTIGVVLRAINYEVPRSTTLDSLKVVEPGEGSDEEYFGKNLIFDGFDNSNLDAIWPTGATGAEIKWIYEGGTSTVKVAEGKALPAAPAGKVLKGFEIVFAGSIAPNTAAEVRYLLKSNPAETFVAAGASVGPLKNVIDVTGEKKDLPQANAHASATLSLVAPSIGVKIDKQLGPKTVLPGQDVVVQLSTEITTGGGRTKPTEIVVEDSWSGEGTFWDAFDAKEILPPISRPLNGGNPASKADLNIYVQHGADGWVPTPLRTNPDENAAISVPAGTTGLRFVYTNDKGLSQTTYVKPNISFTSREHLRSDSSVPTAGEFEKAKQYENVASVTGKGMLDDRVVTGTATDKENVGIRGSANGTGPGPGQGIWASKAWAHDHLTSQSSATSWTTQRWATTRTGYQTVHLQDAAAPSKDGAGTVFEAFNLTHIRPIRTSGDAGTGTVDAQLRWDLVTDVLLYDGTGWESVTPPAGGWMHADGSGFKGYTLSADQQESTVGARLVLTENAAAREAAADAGDLTAPKAGSGVSASAEIRSFRLDWQLRSIARPAPSSPEALPKWVKNDKTIFNCGEGSFGCIDNVFGVEAFPSAGNPERVHANDTIQLLDGAPNVDVTKRVQPLDPASNDPSGDLAEGIDMVIPNVGELPADDYPRARYSMTAKNSSTTQNDARGSMKLAKIRLADTGISGPQPKIDESQFAGRDFASEVAGSQNHFNIFDLKRVSYNFPSYVDVKESQVELWLYSAAGSDGKVPGTQEVFTLEQVMNEDPAFLALLPRVIGISTVFSGTDPSRKGNSILVGDEFTMNLDVQLRQTERLSGDPMRVDIMVPKTIMPNVAVAMGWDAVVTPSAQPSNTSQATVALTQAKVAVALEKAILVEHGDSSDDTVYETDPTAPVNVSLTATANGSTAPIHSLRIEDDSASFWSRFKFESFKPPTHPSDADSAKLQVKVGKNWVPYEEFVLVPGDAADIVGVAVDFTNTKGNTLFPQGASSWNSSWGKATLPFTVKLRPEAQVTWTSDIENNTATAIAHNNTYGSAEDAADGQVLFKAGRNSLQVEKRAPNDTGTHQAEPLVSLPWQLVFTNTGTSYLPIDRVTDELPEALSWDGENIEFTSIPGPSGISGLTTDPEKISVELSADGRNLVFVWPTGQRMEPGEKMTIDLGLILQPLPTGQQAVNSVVVETGVPLDECLQPKNYGQHPAVPTAANQCSNTNFVQPRTGTVVGAVKTVNGEYIDTLGENLVKGALNVRSGAECEAKSYRPIGSEYTRNPCASYTAVGATDTWKLQHLNTGSNPLSRMVIVDMLPEIGDKMLAGGTPRGSTFKPVLVGSDLNSVFRLTGLPAQAKVQIEVTKNPAACVGAIPGSSLWVTDPTCGDAKTNPANEWVLLENYVGDIVDIAGIRVDIDMTHTPLQPAGNVILEFETVNRVVDVAEHGLKATLEQYSTPQFAWNQNGVIAWDTSQNRVNLPSAPQRAGVTIKTAPLVVSKIVRGPGLDNAPEFFPVQLECTVPSGLAEPERVPLDLGDFAELSVPKNGSVTVPGLPIGTNCVATEAGEVGAHGETGRSIETQPGVSPSTDGLEATILIRERPGNTTILNLSNTYTLGGFTVEKAVLSADQFPVAGTHLKQEYEFDLVCQVKGMTEPITRSFTLKAGEQHEENELPEGAQCTLTETKDGGAKSTTITIAGQETDGESRDGIIVSAGGGHALVANVFDGVPPGKLENTGTQISAVVAIVAGLLLVGGGALLLARRKREQATH